MLFRVRRLLHLASCQNSCGKQNCQKTLFPDSPFRCSVCFFLHNLFIHILFTHHKFLHLPFFSLSYHAPFSHALPFPYDSMLLSDRNASSYEFSFNPWRSPRSVFVSQDVISCGTKKQSNHALLSHILLFPVKFAQPSAEAVQQPVLPEVQ